MDAPEDCPPALYTLMRSCWAQEPRRRPTFHKLREKLEQETGSGMELGEHTQETVKRDWISSLDIVSTRRFKREELGDAVSGSQGPSP